MIAMIDAAEQAEKPRYPFLRVTTMGEFALACIVASGMERPRYRALSSAELGNRKAALTILKFLLCSPRRRASKAEIIKVLWPGDTHNANHAFDTASSALRRHILYPPGTEGLLSTRRLNGETHFILAAQAWLWVDADALINLARTALRQEQQGNDPLPYLEAAYALDKGEFLEEDPDCLWAQGRRQTIEGTKRRVLYQLVDAYLKHQRTGKAEELLYTFLQNYPEDEDALCRLIRLLADQGRRQEALNVYRYSAEMMREQQKEPGAYTQEIARQLQQGLHLREKSVAYHTLQPQITFTIILIA
ncbi:AfsR/SARP family transcriptional regulator [Dictyobacter kobayashii]|uniref:Bacterial transcriptional activator domain-containing protein n=1 Tax=Dictyobacter kobayashii TaxID=2014872 RepID=A0A402AIB0_9CHLR|nr:bacterial transcriptional activator domain-containing protein [Dictyobacter kobayashii]GCE18793.1 hypothetical protein KDK_25930 [Dictyobacter kobayashii]